MFKFSGQRPSNLGVQDGRLSVCPASPNCVCSCYADDKAHFIEPLAFTGDAAAAMTRLKQVIEAMERTEIITQHQDYLYAEFTSRLMGYVDDGEFYCDRPASVIQVRSASRLGQSDLGVNRKRIEEIRAKFQASNA